MARFQGNLRPPQYWALFDLGQTRESETQSCSAIAMFQRAKLFLTVGTGRVGLKVLLLNACFVFLRTGFIPWPSGQGICVTISELRLFSSMSSGFTPHLV